MRTEPSRGPQASSPPGLSPSVLPEMWAFKVLSAKLTSWIKGELICLHFYSSEKMLVGAAETS